MVASEVAPFAKTGGLADVACGLSRWLGKAGHDVRVVMPMYGRVRDNADWTFPPVPELQDLQITAGDRSYTYSVSTAPLPESDVLVHFVRCPELFGGDAIYGDGPDEAPRFWLLTRAAIDLCQRLQWSPHVFHANDWHTALLPLILKTGYAWDTLFADTKVLLALHNLGYQGVFALDLLDSLGLADERHLLDASDTENDTFSFLRTGVKYADALCTVSETYAREIQDEELGMGLAADLQKRRAALRGIVNGVDYGEWDPRHDAFLPQIYGPGDFAGKAANKAALLKDFGLPGDDDLPLFGIVSRLTQQKGIELIAEAMPVVLQERGARLVALGSGEPRYEQFLQSLRDSYPDLVAVYRGYNNELAHRIEAAADVFLMPSRYEPCGLNQLYSLRYGTVPLVRQTGGLADTVRPFDPATGEGTGFSFEPFSSKALLDTMRRALSVYRDQDSWRQLVNNGMAEDWSWDRQGPKYVALYEAMQG